MRGRGFPHEHVDDARAPEPGRSRTRGSAGHCPYPSWAHRPCRSRRPPRRGDATAARRRAASSAPASYRRYETGPRRRRRAGRCRAARRHRAPPAAPAQRPRRPRSPRPRRSPTRSGWSPRPRAWRRAGRAPPARIEQRRHQPRQRRRVGAQIRLEVQFAPRQHDRHSVVTHGPGHQDHVTGADGGRAEGDRAFEHPDAGRRDVAAVGLPPLHHFGVAGDDVDARGGGGAPPCRRRCGAGRSMGKPSSRMKLADRCRGRAPPTARSLTVPLTARSPIEPPGKNSGDTTKASVVNASRVPFDGEDGLVLERLQARVAQRVEEDGIDQGGAGACRRPRARG